MEGEDIKNKRAHFAATEAILVTTSLLLNELWLRQTIAAGNSSIGFTAYLPLSASFRPPTAF
jgi:hypothetical protein